MDEVLKHVRPVELRYHLAAAHYRSTLEFSYESVTESAVGFSPHLGFSAETGRRTATGGLASECPDAFVAAMDDDLGVPAAVAVIFDTVRVGNGAIEADDEQAARRAWRSVSAMCSYWANLLEIRGAARDRESGAGGNRIVGLGRGTPGSIVSRPGPTDWARADAIPGIDWPGAGVQIEDRPTRPVWAVVSDGR